MRTGTEVNSRSGRLISPRGERATVAGPIQGEVAAEPGDFVRSLGRAPRFGHVNMEMLESLDAMAEVFGPPERKGSVAYWNFVGRDGVFGTIFCTVVGRRRDLTFSLSARASAEASHAFHEWTFDRLAKVCLGDSIPLFLGGAKYEIRRVA
jgi:hypothetical protein